MVYHLLVSEYVSTQLINFMLQFTTSQRGKRILMFEYEKVRYIEKKNGLTIRRCSKKTLQFKIVGGMYKKDIHN